MEKHVIEMSSQPVIAVGIVTEVHRIEIELEGEYRLPFGGVASRGRYFAFPTENGIRLEGLVPEGLIEAGSIELTPIDPTCSFVIPAVKIGIGFHWERSERQRFGGSLRLNRSASGSLNVINLVGVEGYLASVISSEMSATSHAELLKAHAITSRSWLLAQIKPWRIDRNAGGRRASANAGEVIRWYDRENHDGFDVCADDHCQRYQGTTKATTTAVQEAIDATWGEVLFFGDEVCDARFSKSCGGMSEDYRAAWQDIEIPYLSARVCADSWPDSFASPLTDEQNARAWIEGEFPAYCNTKDNAVLARILPGFDQETVDFFRWQKRLAQEEVRRLLKQKVGVDLGGVLSLEAIERGRSGRIIRLRITGEKGSFVIGKELEIRRALSPSHLYSSAFVASPGAAIRGVPQSFLLKGAGWGHGVGLCQIGAAVMAEQGIDASRILLHYFLNAEIKRLYAR